MAQKRDDAKDLARAGRSALAAGRASLQVESDEGRAVMSRKRQMKPTSQPVHFG
jgi:hypothetical protein